MIKLLTLALLAVLATGDAAAQQMVVEAQGQTLLIQQIDANTYVSIVDPKAGCASASQRYSTLVLYTESPKNVLTAIWQRGMPAPPSWPAWVGGFGTEMCNWYNKNH
jgi:hypothetical protein